MKAQGKNAGSSRTSETAALQKRLRLAEQRLRKVEQRYETAMAAINESIYDWDIARDRVHYSESMQRAIGLPPEVLKTTKDWWDRIHPDDLPRYRAALIAHFKGNTKRFECDYRYRTQDDTWHWARQHGVAVRNRQGRAVRMIGSTGDITELKERERQLAEKSAILETTLENIDQGITMVDKDLRTIALNRRFLELLDMPPERFARGFHMEEAFRFNAERGEYGSGDIDEMVRVRLDAVRRFEPHAFERKRPDGTVIAVRGKPLPGGAGFVSTYTDVTEQRRAEEARTKSEERYALATSAALEGIYEWDVEAGRLFLTERAKTFFSFVGDELTPAAWNMRVHGEDYAGYRAAIIDHFKGRAPHLEHEYRIADAHGGYKWVLDRGVGVRNASGVVTKVVGALSDITQRKLAEIEVRRARDQAEEALEQQTATSEILRVISSSPTDVQPVFDVIGARAEKLCDAEISVVSRIDGELIRLAALHGVTPAGIEAIQRVFPMRLSAETVTARTIRNRAVVHVRDVLADPSYEAKDTARGGGFRGCLGVPMVREGQVIGAIFVARATPGFFADTQVELLKTFADQAVIAVDNVRLFTELQARNRDLTTALDQKTATSEILRVISSSHTDVQPVFDAIVRSAVRLCGADHSIAARFDGELLHPLAHHGFSPEALKIVERMFPMRPGPENMLGRAALSKAVVNLPDMLADPTYSRDYAMAGGWRSGLGVPMLRDGELIGALAVSRTEPSAFPDHLVELLKTFAEQAVIAVENVRLFTELQARNRDLTEALEQQTATSDILRVISQSQRDVQPVFDTIAAAALKLCGASSANVFTIDGGFIRLAALVTSNPKAVEAVRRSYPRPIGLRDTAASRAVLTRNVAEIPDVLKDSEFGLRDTALAAGFRSILSVPLFRNGGPIGAIAVGRPEPGPFPDKQITLLQTFADQAVIAIENVRLFKELEARTAELTKSVEELQALGEVGQAVSSTLDLETVLSTIVSRAAALAGMDGGVIYEYDETREEFYLHAADNLPDELVEALRAAPIRKGEGAIGRLAVTGEPVQIRDIMDEAIYKSRVREILIRLGYRSLLAVPLLREDHLLGALAVNRISAGEFEPRVIDLLKTFATQSTLAIQNARLFREIEEKSRQLETASRHKSEFLANMSHELRTPLNAIIGFSEVLSERLFGEVNDKQAEYLNDILESGRHLLSLINDILDLSKIEAGRMELEPTEFDLPAAIENTLILVRERAQRRGITLGRTVDEHLGTIRADERKVKQVLLNLLSNALKFTPEGGQIDVRAAVHDGEAEISVTDTGVGIAPEDQEAVFEEFRQVGTAAKKVEGTGLGLAISRKFIELHGGRIWVKSQVGIGSTFAFTLPLAIDQRHQAG